jgi:hypothetical protein
MQITLSNQLTIPRGTTRLKFKSHPKVLAISAVTCNCGTVCYKCDGDKISRSVWWSHGLYLTENWFRCYSLDTDPSEHYAVSVHKVAGSHEYMLKTPMLTRYNHVITCWLGVNGRVFSELYKPNATLLINVSHGS